MLKVGDIVFRTRDKDETMMIVTGVGEFDGDQFIVVRPLATNETAHYADRFDVIKSGKKRPKWVNIVVGPIYTDTVDKLNG